MLFFCVHCCSLRWSIVYLLFADGGILIAHLGLPHVVLRAVPQLGLERLKAFMHLCMRACVHACMNARRPMVIEADRAAKDGVKAE